MKKNEISKNDLFAHVPVPRALAAMAVPTVISQMVNLVYNMVDGFFIGRTGNSYMVAATSLVLTLTMLHLALSNLFGVGGGSLVARLMGIGKEDKARRGVCALAAPPRDPHAGRKAKRCKENGINAYSGPWKPWLPGRFSYGQTCCAHKKRLRKEDMND